jgi:hypothetical protein
MWKDMIMAQFEDVSQHFPGWIQKNLWDIQSPVPDLNRELKHMMDYYSPQPKCFVPK